MLRYAWKMQPPSIKGLNLQRKIFWIFILPICASIYFPFTLYMQVFLWICTIWIKVNKKSLRFFRLSPLISFSPFPPLINHFSPTLPCNLVTKSKQKLFKAKNKSLNIAFETILHIVVFLWTWFGLVVNIGVNVWKSKRHALKKAMKFLLLWWIYFSA